MKPQKLVNYLKNWGPLPLIKRHICPLALYEGMREVESITPPILNLGIRRGRVVSITHR